eukprot:CAMPEP_0197684680 /NCGR_PEP_ID=MMETSP1338-20131121/99819_1 /TAXON_ID=43686 ORGANISM="Pelagodinium beii, Strain RCC1491" /NCGR_SAMPLE_ID=MMETSP1338 /ASSEMBLY_ACC=CAM_ASM_000754 /LENGTH=68 /DNA_ID=CAMNT_0043266421 /DNA_START=89 /DNA_END=292 /DNA_ORIENTATION=-
MAETCLPSTPRACLGLPAAEIQAFHAYDLTLEDRHQLNPRYHEPIIPSVAERRTCDFWDAAPAMSFHN